MRQIVAPQVKRLRTTYSNPCKEFEKTDPGKALQCYLEETSRYPDYLYGWSRIGYLSRQLGKLNDAENVFRVCNRGDHVFYIFRCSECVPYYAKKISNQQACFFAEKDYLFYLEWLREYARSSACFIHSYVLMINHVHILLTPRKHYSVGDLMKRLGQ